MDLFIGDNMSEIRIECSGCVENIKWRSLKICFGRVELGEIYPTENDRFYINDKSIKSFISEIDEIEYFDTLNDAYNKLIENWSKISMSMDYLKNKDFHKLWVEKYVTPS